MSNDSDVDNNYQGVIDPQSAVLDSGLAAGQGSLNFGSNGGFTYIPLSFPGGNISFTYHVKDSQNATSGSATVSIHAAAPPTAVNDSFAATEDVPLVVTTPTSTHGNGVLFNDSDPTENQSLTAVIAVNTPPNKGTVQLGSDGSFTFTPSHDYFGTASFTYNAQAGTRSSLTPATVTITVGETNDPPTANGDTYTAIALLNNGFANQTLSPSPLANDSSFPDTSPPGDFNVSETLSISGVKTNSGGSPASTAATALGGFVTISGSGTLLYTPPGPAGSNPPTGADSFVYTVSDGRGGFTDATVTVNVINFVPKTVSGTVYVDSNGSGSPDAGDLRLSGVRVDLNGTDFQ